MWLLKRLSPQLIILLVLALISTIGIVAEKSVATLGNKIIEKPIIIIDAGHGGLPNTTD